MKALAMAAVLLSASSAVRMDPAKAASPDTKQICRTWTEIGSRLKKKRVCRTRQQWAEDKAHSRNVIDRGQAVGLIDKGGMPQAAPNRGGE